jgi:hypothetical protein
MATYITQIFICVKQYVDNGKNDLVRHGIPTFYSIGNDILFMKKDDVALIIQVCTPHAPTNDMQHNITFPPGVKLENNV